MKWLEFDEKSIQELNKSITWDMKIGYLTALIAVIIPCLWNVSISSRDKKRGFQLKIKFSKMYVRNITVKLQHKYICGNSIIMKLKKKKLALVVVSLAIWRVPTACWEPELFQLVFNNQSTFTYKELCSRWYALLEHSWKHKIKSMDWTPYCKFFQMQLCYGHKSHMHENSPRSIISCFFINISTSGVAALIYEVCLRLFTHYYFYCFFGRCKGLMCFSVPGML